MSRQHPSAGFINPTIAESAGVEDENGNRIVAAPEPEKVTIEQLPIGSVWEQTRGEYRERRIVLSIYDGLVFVHSSAPDEPGVPIAQAVSSVAAASFTGWTRIDPGKQIERMQTNLEQLRSVADKLSLSARFADLARVGRALGNNCDVLSARSYGEADPWAMLVDARGMLAQVAASHGMLEGMVSDLAGGIGRDDFLPVHDAIVAALEVEALDQETLAEAVSEAVGHMQPRAFQHALLGLVAIGWVNPPGDGAALSLSDKAREVLGKSDTSAG